MNRPQSQASHRQKSNDIRDLRSKTKLPSKKHHKQSVKRARQNTPSHMDSDRRLIIQSHTNRNQLRQRLQKKNSQDDKDMWRSGLVRFIRPRLSERDYKRCKKLFQIFGKIQKCKFQIMAINTSSVRYMRETMSLHQSQVLRELKEQQLKLQTEEERILLEIQNQSKENVGCQVFSGEKGNVHAKHSHLMHKDANTLSELKPTQHTQNILIQHGPSSMHKRKQSSLSKKSKQIPSNQTTDRNSNYLFELFEFMWNLDSRVRENVPDKNFAINKNDWMLKGIKDWIKKKYETIEEALVSVTKLCNAAKTNFNGYEASSQKDQKDHSYKGTVEKDSHKDNIEVSQSYKSPKICKSFNQVFKSSAIKKLQQNFTSTQKCSTNFGDFPTPTTQEGTISFTKMFSQLQHYVNQINYLKKVQQRNGSLTKQLLGKSTQAAHERQQRQVLEREKMVMEREKMALEKQISVRREYEELGNLVRKDNQLLKKRNQKLDQDNSKLLGEIHRMRNQLNQITSQKDHLQQQLQKAIKQAKQNQKYQKYYRQTLSLQKQLKILSQQNQKLVQQLKDVKQQYDQLINNTNKKQEQLPYSKPSNSEDDKKKETVESSHQKSIKQSSNTSLIYKQLEKNNKKLSDQNKKLQEANKELSEQNTKITDQNMKLTDQNKKLSGQNHVLSQQNHKISQLNHKLCQQGHKINEEHKRLKEEYNQLQESDNNLQQQLNNCNLKISELNETNKSLIQRLQQEVNNNQETKMKEQMVFLQQQNAILLQENKRILDKNKKIQEEFEYIVKEKLELESMINQKAKKNVRILKNKEKLISSLEEKIIDLAQGMVEIKGKKEIVLRQVNAINKSVSDMFSCINEQITSAFGIFVNEFSQKLYLQSQNSQKDHKQTQKVDASIQTQPQQQQANQQKINQNLPTTTLQQQYQQQAINMTQQYQALVEQLNHCVYQLNTYKNMHDQVQIQKEIQKKYLEEDLSQLRIRLSLVEKEYLQVKFEADRLRMEMGEGRREGGKDGKVMVSQYTQTEMRQLSHKIESNFLSLTYLNEPISTPKQHTSQPTNLTIQSNLSSYHHIPQTCQNNTNLKINCESFSINITPTQLQSLKPTNLPQQPQNQQQQQQQLITFESWLEQVKLDSQPQTERFKSFCSVNFCTNQSFTNPMYVNEGNERMKQENNQLKLEVQALKQNIMLKSSSVVQCRSPLKDILSPNQKIYTQIQNNQQTNGSQINIMGSLYNRFSFPKLQNLENNTNDLKQPVNDKNQHQQNTHQVYPTLQKTKTSKTQDLPSVKEQSDRMTDKEQNKLPSSQEEEDQSFDLCII